MKVLVSGHPLTQEQIDEAIQRAWSRLIHAYNLPDSTEAERTAKRLEIAFAAGDLRRAVNETPNEG